MVLDGGQSCSKILHGESTQLPCQVLNPDEGRDGKDWGENEDNRRKDAKKFHEKGASASRSWD